MNLYDILNPIIADQTGLPVTIENVPYVPEVRSAGFVRVSDLPSEPFIATIGWDRTLQITGMFQIDIMTPLNTGRYENIDALIAYFNDRDNRFFNDSLEVTYAWRQPSFPGEKWMQTSMSLRYQYFV